MLPFLTITLVILAGTGLFALRPVVSRITPTLNRHALIDYQIKYQSLQLLWAALILLLAWLLNPGGFARFFRPGDPSTRISPIPWLGVTGAESWLEIALSIGSFVTLGTAAFMYFQLKKAGATPSGLPRFLGWAVLFSIANAFAEEAIFRVALIAPLYGLWNAALLALISGVIFGLPHYFGMPKGLLGALMAGFLGWLLALSLMQTQGLLLAWGIHFVQDVVIITSMLLISNNNKKGVA